jgi:hypothetical protein
LRGCVRARSQLLRSLEVCLLWNQNKRKVTGLRDSANILMAPRDTTSGGGQSFVGPAGGLQPGIRWLLCLWEARQHDPLVVVVELVLLDLTVSVSSKPLLMSPGSKLSSNLFNSYDCLKLLRLVWSMTSFVDVGPPEALQQYEVESMSLCWAFRSSPTWWQIPTNWASRSSPICTLWPDCMSLGVVMVFILCVVQEPCWAPCKKYLVGLL